METNLTEKLRKWRSIRNITNADYLVFVGNILEELLEVTYTKNEIEAIKNEIIDRYFFRPIGTMNELDIVDTIKDIKVFCINETELMGYDDVKTDNEVFKHINCRRQDPMQYMEWDEFGASGKWKKDAKQPDKEIYQPNYESCKL